MFFGYNLVITVDDKNNAKGPNFPDPLSFENGYWFRKCLAYNVRFENCGLP